MVHQKHASWHTHLCQHAMVRVGHQHHYTGPVEYGQSSVRKGPRLGMNVHTGTLLRYVPVHNAACV